MTDHRPSTDPLVLALAAGIREIAARRAAERAEEAERRRRITIVGDVASVTGADDTLGPVPRAPHRRKGAQ